MRPVLLTILLLTLSNVFMTFAWYAHLKELNHKPWIAAALASWGGTMVIVSHDAGFVRDLAPDRALLMPDGELDHWSDDLLDLVELA